MSLLLRDPFFSPFDDLWRRMDTLERAFTGPLASSTAPSTERALAPAAGLFKSLGSSTHAFDIVERPTEFALMADAPGMAPEDITVELKDNVLTVRGEHKTDVKEEKDGKLWRRERTFRSFSRQFVLPDNAKPEEVAASLKDGVLTVTIPKLPPPPEPEKTQPKRIPVLAATKAAPANGSGNH